MRFNQDKSDAFPEPCSLVTKSEYERPKNQPHRWVAVSRKRPSQGGTWRAETRFRQLLGTEQHKSGKHRDQRETRYRNGGTRQRL